MKVTRCCRDPLRNDEGRAQYNCVTAQTAMGAEMLGCGL